MLFSIEADQGNRIVGYLVPDDYSGSPSLRIEDGGGAIAVLPCLEERAALVVAGRHATGRCGFTIDDTVVPGLASKDDLELYDAETGILIYRRRRASQVAHQRIFRLETHLFPLWRLDDGIERKFQYFHKGIERHGRETATQLFLLNSATSLYLSGRLGFRSYEDYINDTFRCITLIRDPYAELAERLLTLKHVRKFGDELLGARDMIAYDAAIDFAQGIESDDRVLRRAFRTMPKAAIANFANPLTRQLTVSSADEPPPKGAIARALDALSSFAIVGLREYQHLFIEELEALLGAPPGTLPVIREFPSVGELAAHLQCVPEAELLIEQDLEIYHTAKSALEDSLGCRV